MNEECLNRGKKVNWKLQKTEFSTGPSFQVGYRAGRCAQPDLSKKSKVAAAGTVILHLLQDQGDCEERLFTFRDT